jgi:hypothetical protein
MPPSSFDDDDFAAVFLLFSSSHIPLTTGLIAQVTEFFLGLLSFNIGIIAFLDVPWWTLTNHPSKGCTTPVMIRPLLP